MTIILQKSYIKHGIIIQVEYFAVPLWGIWSVICRTPSPSLFCSQMLHGVLCEWTQCQFLMLYSTAQYELWLPHTPAHAQPGPLPVEEGRTLPCPCTFMSNPPTPSRPSEISQTRITFSSDGHHPCTIALAGFFPDRGGSSDRTKMVPFSPSGHSANFCRVLCVRHCPKCFMGTTHDLTTNLWHKWGEISMLPNVISEYGISFYSLLY